MKTLMLLFLMSLYVSNTTAQTFQNIIGSKDNFEISNCAATDAEGNLLIAGYSFIPDSGKSYTFLTKLNSDGTINTKFSISELQTIFSALNPVGIEALHDGAGKANGYVIVFRYINYLVIARLNEYSKVVWAKIIYSAIPGRGKVVQAAYSPITNKLNGFYLVALYGGDNILIKLSAEDGSIKWQKNILYPDNRNVFGIWDINADEDGGCLAVASLELETTKPVLMKFSPTGRLLWGKRYNFLKGNATITAMAATKGGYILSGTESGKFYYPNLTFKVDKSGGIIWANDYSIKYSDNFPQRIITDNNGNIIIAGPISYQQNDTNHKAYIVKLDSMGNVVFGKKYLNKVVLNDVKLAPGGYYATGHTDFETNYHPSDLYVIKTDTAGNIGGNCNPTDVLHFKKSAAEYKKASTPEYSITEDTLTVHDIKLTTLKILTPIRQDRCGTEVAGLKQTETQAPLNNLSVSPNPTRGIVTAAYNSTVTSRVQLNVYDKTGKLMFNKTEQAVKGENTYQLNLSNLINGIYNLQIISGIEQSRAMFVIEK